MDQSYKGKKVVIIGLGNYEKGSGVSALRYFYSQKAKIVATDLKTKDQLAPQLKRLSGLRGIKYVLGKHDMRDILTADLIVKNPGVNNNSPYIVAARKKKIPIVSDISIFLQNSSNLIVGITGTRGKSTTSSLLSHILLAQFPDTRLGGNIKVSPLTFMNDITESTPVVLELSSWMCHDLSVIKKSPQIAVVTNMFVDHLNSYKNFSEYQKDKSYIYSYQNKNDISVFSKDNKHSYHMSKKSPSRVYLTSLRPLKKNEKGVYLSPQQDVVFVEGVHSQKLCNRKDFPLLGEHNTANLLQACCVAYLMGVAPAKIAKRIKNFESLEYRMQTVGNYKGVTYINDSTATSPDGVVSAINALGRGLTLIAGGVNKELDFSEMARCINNSVRELILLPGTATDALLPKIKIPKSRISLVGSMKEAVTLASQRTRKGGKVLLSPGGASFGLFKNEFDRGDKFNEAVAKLRK